MAKSLKNFITIQDFLRKHSPRLLRYLLLKSHYRSLLDYNEKLVSQAKREIEKIDEFINKLKMQSAKRKTTIQNSKLIKGLIRKTKKDFARAMDDDFNAPVALASVFHLIGKGNYLLAKEKLTPVDARDILNFLRKVDRVFNFIFWQRLKKEKIPENILKLVKDREKYRQKGNFKKADEIRRKIKDLGYWIEDTKEGPKIKRIT